MENEMTYAELERIAGVERVAPDPFWVEAGEYVEDLQREEAVREIELLSEGWRDDRNFPLPGFESPRFLSPREQAYKAWFWSSPDAAHVRALRGVEESRSDAGHYQRQHGPQPDEVR